MKSKMELSYKLSLDAEQELQEIARYTLNNWGKNLFYRYRNGLKKRFNDIGKHKVIKKSFSERFPELYVTKYRYHFIF